MIKIYFFLLFSSLCLINFCHTKIKEDYRFQTSTIYFFSDTLNFGEISQDKEFNCDAKFKNIGNVPLVITDVKASCGCTSVDWSRKPVLAGNEGVIKISFKEKYPGRFFKTIQVSGNFYAGKTLYITGNVVENRSF